MCSSDVMRWSGQEIEVEQGDALPGLVKLSSLVRSVQTPEFAGITFHEVLAKSALNHVPGSAGALPFGWTINPYRGCSHACLYCMSPETLILMADGRQKPLWQVEVGDKIYGTEVRGIYRRYVTPRFKLNGGRGNRLPDHLDGRNGVGHAAVTTASCPTEGGSTSRARMSGPEQRPYLTGNNKLMGFGLNGLSALQQPSYFGDRIPQGLSIGHGARRRDDVREDLRLRIDATCGSIQFRLALADDEALEPLAPLPRDGGYPNGDSTLLRSDPDAAADDGHLHEQA